MEIIKKIFTDKPKESEWLDYKEKINYLENRYHFFTDINSFSNNDYMGNQYIVYGVKDNNGEFDFIGLSDYPKIKEEDIQKWVYDNIEPKIKIALIKFPYENKKFLVLQINADKSQQPFVFKKDYNFKSDAQRINQGDAWIRISSSTRRLRREDLESIYGKRTVMIPLEVSLYDKELSITDNEPGNLLMAIKNPSAMTQIFSDVCLDVLDENGVKLTSNKMIAFLEDNELKGKKLTRARLLELNKSLFDINENLYSVSPITIPKGDALFGVGVFNFDSIDAFKLRLDQYGLSNISYTFKLYFKDDTDRLQDFTYENCTIYAKGNFLWKVKQKAKNNDAKE